MERLSPQGFKIEGVSSKFSEEAIESAWTGLDPYEASIGEGLKEDPYKKERPEILKFRYLKGLTNFGNIGGNHETRVTKSEDAFVEANWITPYLIATGYPSKGQMRENYWKMVEGLRKTHSVFIVNFMNAPEVENYGGWFFDAKKIANKKYIAFVLNPEDQPIYFYHYPCWEDHGEGDQKIVQRLIKHLYKTMNSLKLPLIIANCRAGVGRTGTFANLLHFYKKIKESEELNQEDFSINAIVENIKAFRDKRGDQQFVQSKAQFMMLCRMVQYFFNEEIDKRLGRG